MIEEGQIVLFSFPQTDQAEGKLRPALVIRSLPGPHNDWLICMISSQLRHELPEYDEVLREDDSDFEQTGLKTASLVRTTRLAVVSGDVLRGAIGVLSQTRLNRVQQRVGNWVRGDVNPETR